LTHGGAFVRAIVEVPAHKSHDTQDGSHANPPNEASPKACELGYGVTRRAPRLRIQASMRGSETLLDSHQSQSEKGRADGGPIIRQDQAL
jgi:hypothetical protein